MAASKEKATEQNIVSIPASGTGAPFVAFEEGFPHIRVNVYGDDGSRSQYELNFSGFDEHESMGSEQYAFVIRKEIIASGRIDLNNWTLRQQYDPNQGSSGLSASGVAF